MSDSRLIEIIEKWGHKEILDLSDEERNSLAAAISAEYVRREDCPKYCELGTAPGGKSIIIKLKEERKP